MKIEILGTGCSKCKKLEEFTKQAVSQLDGFYEIKKIEDIEKIMSYNVITTPALVINGVVKSKGKLLNPEEIIKLIKEN